jgi:molybdopterin/thiamine biosynthesis adenylyltransferase
MTTLVFGEESSAALRDRLLSGSPNEAAAVLTCGVATAKRGTRLLVRKIAFLGNEDYLEQGPDRLVIAPPVLAREMKIARDEQLSLIFVHTHPLSHQPEFSSIDDSGEEVLLPSVYARATTGPHGALVLGQTGFDGRIRDASMSAQAIDMIEDVSRSVNRSYRRPHDLQPHYLDTVRNDRSIRTLGADGQHRMAQVRIAVVGAGGTGSIVAEHLAYLGVGAVKLIDYDKVDMSNLNRLVGALPQDVGRSKATVQVDRIRAISPSTKAADIIGDIVFETFARELLDCDVIFGCTDSHGSRAVINQLAYQYYIPAIDLGLRIDTDQAGSITAMGGRVQLLSPGLPCLLCSGLLDPEQVRRDFMTPDERGHDPYIVGAPQPQPAVVTLNGVISSLATTMLLSVVAGFPSDSRYQNYVIERGTVRSIQGRRTPACIVCSPRGALGRGDRWSYPWRTP